MRRPSPPGAPTRWVMPPSRSVASLLSLVLLSLLLPTPLAQAYEQPTAATSTVLTYPSGLTTTLTRSGATTVEAASTIGSRGYTGTDFTPDLATGVQAFSVGSSFAGCPVTTGTCSGLGTFTLTFSQPLTNPVLHVAGLGGSYELNGTTTNFHAILNLTTPGVSLTRLSGANLAVSGGTVSTINNNVSANCASLGTAGATNVAGCGSVRLVGTGITAVTFDVTGRTFRASGNGTGTLPATTSTGALVQDVFVATVTADQDYGDAPATFDASNAARNLIGPLTLGAGVTVDNPDTPNSTTSPQPSATASTDGSDDGTTAFAGQGVGATGYSKTVALSGVTKAATVCGWIDYNRSGTFENTTAERACAQVAAGDTSATLTWSGSPASAGASFARLRVAYGSANLSATGPSDSGETEDYPITFTAPAPALTLTKTASRSTTSSTGDVTTYTYVATNTGNVSIANVRVTDPQSGLSALSCTPTAPATLAVGVGITCTATRATTQADLTAGGTITNTATATGTPTAGTLTSPTATATVTVQQNPVIDIEKTASRTTISAAGQAVTYSMLVRNTGNVPLTSLLVSDPKTGLSTITCSPIAQGGTLNPGSTTTCTATYSTTQADINTGSTDNTANARATAPNGGNVTDTSSVSIPATRTPSIDLTKSASPTSFTTVGTAITYTFTVRNTGNVTLSNVQVEDPLGGLSALSCTPALGSSLAPNASMTCTASRATTQADINAGSVVNTATATGTSPSGATPATVTDTGSASVSGPSRTPGISLTKTASPTTVSAVGQSVTYTFIARNTGNVSLTGVAITDPLGGLSALSCTPGQPATLLPNATLTCTATRAATQADLNNGSIANTATVAGSTPTGVTPATVTASASATVATTAAPNMTLVKTASPTTYTTVGQQISYTFTATNTGNVSLSAMAISDPQPGLSALSCTPAQPATRAPGEQLVCTATRPVTQADIDAGSVTNTATVTGTPPTGPAITRTASATINATRTNTLALTKSPSPATVTAAGDVVTYTFVGRNTGNTTLTGVSIADPRTGLSSLACTPAAPATLAPNATLTCSATYLATQADVNAGSFSNTATITGTGPGGVAVSTTATSAVTAARTPVIDVVKTAAPTTVTAAGQVITYTFVARNTGNVTLANVAVTDPKTGLSALSCGTPAPVTLAPNATLTCTATYTATQADINAGSISNTATATGTPPAGANVTDTDPEIVTATRTPAIDVVKTATPSTVTAAGQLISYTFVGRNTGNVTLTGVSVTDPKTGLSALSCTPGQPATLAPNETVTCTASYTTTQADINAGSISNTATITATSPTGTITDTDAETVAATRTNALTLTKTATPVAVASAGSTVSYSFVARNTGNTTLTAVSISDPLTGLSALSCTPGQPTTLAPNTTLSCTSTYTVTQADIDAGSIINLATATATAPGGGTVRAQDDAVVSTTRTPAIDLAKTVSPATVTAAGQSVTYTFVGRNTGNVTLRNVAVADPLANLSPITCTPAAPATLTPNATITCTATYTATQADVNAGSIVNTATISGVEPTGAGVSDTDPATVTIPRTPSIELTKTPTPTTVNAAGDVVTYTFVARNTGNVTLTAAAITDPRAGLSALTCTPGQPATLQPNATISCTATAAITQAEVDAGVATNTATASGTPPTGPAVSDSDTAQVTVPPAPAIEVVKTADPETVSRAGQVVTYTFVGTNTGNVTLSAVALTDPLPRLSAPSCAPAAPATLAPGGEITCTATYVVSQDDVNRGSVTNTATLTGRPPTGPAVSDTDDATVTAPGAADITLAKSANPVAVSAAGQTVTYSLVASNTGNTTLTGVIIDDPQPGLSDLTCTPGQPATLAPNDQLSCRATYDVTQADVNAGSVFNTATVTGTPPNGPAVTDSDDAVVTATPAAAIALTKTVTPDEASEDGDEVTFIFVGTNTGNVTLTGVAVTDPLPGLGDLSCSPGAPATLEPGEDITCTATYDLTQADVDAGSVQNLARITGTPPVGPAVTDTDGATVTIESDPAISLAKTAAPSAIGVAGDEVDYTFVATNTGNVTLSGVTVVDELPGLSALTCTPAQPATLAPDATLRCTATYLASQADADAGEIDNIATTSGRPPVGDPVSDDDDATVDVIAAPAIEVVKTAGPTTVANAGDEVTYTFVGTNTGNVTLSGVSITDPLDDLSALACTPAAPAVLAPDAVITCSATYTATQADIDAGEIVNTATITGLPPVGEPVADTDTETVTATRAPALTLVKTADPATVTAAGDEVTYTFVGTNTGNETLSAVAITDELEGLSALACTPVAPATLAPDAQITCTATYAATQADIDAGEISNTATITGTPPVGDPVTAEDSATVTAAPAPAIELVKTAEPGTVAAAGDVVTYTFTATNIGNVSLSGVEITDDLAGLGALGCTPAAPATLAPTASLTCTATRVVTQTDINTGSIINLATATGTPPVGPVVADTDDAVVTAAPAPALELVKTADPTTVDAAGDEVTYTFVGTNTGNVTLTEVAVADERAGLSDLDCTPAAPAELDPGAVITCTATYVATQGDLDAGEIVNTARITGTPPLGEPVSATDTATVTAAPAPSIAVVKTADPTSVDAAGDLVTYTFTGTNTGNVTLADVVVTDELAGLSELVCTPAAPATLAPDATITCTATYAATQGDIDAGAFVNAATIIGTPPEGEPVTGTDAVTVTVAPTPELELVKTADRVAVSGAGEEINYTFTATNIGNVTLTVVAIVDDVAGLSDLDCAPAAPTTLAPDAVLVCTATYVVTQADIDDGSIVNLATVSGTPPTGPAVSDADDAVVTAAPTPALDLVKTADPATVAAAGDAVTYTLVATNVGNVTLTGVAIVDDLAGLSELDCDPAAPTTLAPQVAITCTATYVATQGDIDAGEIVNTATASATPPDGDPVSDSATETVSAAPAPALELVKTADLSTVAAAGDNITYSFVGTNTGNVTLTDVAVTDDLEGLSALDCTPAAPATLAPDAVITCTATYTATQADLDAGQIVNTATITGTPPEGDPVADTDDETVTAAPAPALELVKTATPTSVGAAGEQVTYTFVGTNTGNVTLTDVAVTDELEGLSALDCNLAAPATLAPDAVLTCTATYAATQADLDAGQIVNTATITGTPPEGDPVADTDDETVTAAPAPALELVKTALPTTVAAAGDIVNYTFVGTNTGNVTLTAVAIDDDFPGLTDLNCTPAAPATLAPDATITCTASYTATQADIDAGDFTNTATITGTPPVGDPVTASDEETVTATPAPAIELTKTADPTTVTAAGDGITYTFVGTNTGNVTLTDVAITDELDGLSDLNCTPAAPATLGPEAQITCTASYAATQGDLDAGEIVNTATITGTPPVGGPVSDTDDETVTAAPAPAIELVKTADPTTVVAAGAEITYTFAATNTGNVTLTGVAITDDRPGLSDLECTPAEPGTLAPDATLTCMASYRATQADVNAGEIVNTASVIGTPPAGEPVTDTDAATVIVPGAAELTLTKTADPVAVSAAGDVITYTFTATNTGNVTLTGAAITDDLPGLSELDCTPAAPTTLEPDETLTCTATYAVTQADIDAGSVVNTATAAGTPPIGPAVADTDDAVVTATPTPALALVKTADPATVTAAGDEVTYTLVGTNIGNVTLTDVTISDERAGLSDLGCTPAAPATLAPDAIITCTATYAATQGDIDAGEIINTASITGTPPEGDPVTGTDSARVTAAPEPSLELAKTAAPTTVSAAGDVITYTFTATNTGNVTLGAVAITDDLPGLSDLDCTPVAPATLAPDASVTCTASYAVTQGDIDAGEIVNTATVTGTPPAGDPVTDSDDATVTAAADPSIEVVKTADPTTVTGAGDLVTYTFVGTNTGNVTLGAVAIDDELTGLTPLSCTPAAPATLAPDETITCTALYLASQGDIDAGEIVNTATITGTPPTGDPVTGADDETVTAAPAPAIALVKTADPASVAAAGDQVTYTFVGTNTGNVTLSDVALTDGLQGLSDLDCTPAAPAELAPNATITCTATYAATQADIDDGEFTNTATIAGSPPEGEPVTATDDATVAAAHDPGIVLTKTADPIAVSAAGDEVTYTFAATNTGNVTLSDVEITDDLAGLTDLDCIQPTTLAPAATLTCTATYAATQADIDAGSIVNVAEVSGTPPEGDPVTDEADAVVSAAPTPALVLTKTASPTTATAVGDEITFTLVARNVGNVTLDEVAIVDALVGPDLDCTPAAPTTLAPGEELSCTASYPVTQADVNAGGLTNSATATGTPPVGDPVSDDDDATVTIAPDPSITLAKTADPTTVSAAGDEVSYTLVGTNTGNVTLSAVSITDGLPGVSNLTCAQPATLEPEATLTCTATYLATQADIDAGEIVNTATITGTPPVGDPVTDSDTVTVTAEPAPALELIKAADPTTVDAAGDEVTYSFVGTNTGNVTLTAVAVTDELTGLSTLDCTPAAPASLAPDATITCTATYAATQADIDAGEIVNTATITGTPPVGEPVADTDDETVTAAAAPAIELVKTADPMTVDAAGDEVTYTFVGTNTGNVTLADVSITDGLTGLSDLDCTPAAPATLAPDATITCTATYTATQGDIDAGEIANTATITGTPPEGEPVTDTDDETVTAAPAPALELVKTADPRTVDAAGDEVTYTFVGTNTGNVTLGTVSITDGLDGLSDLDCAPAAPATLAPDARITCTATYIATQGDLDAGEIVNTATITGTPPEGEPVTDTDDETVIATPAPAIELVKTADPTTVTAAGDEVIYTFVGTNTGNVSLTGVVIADELPGLSDLDCAQPVTLAPDATLTCTATYLATQVDIDNGEIVNTASITGTPPEGDPVNDTDEETVSAAPAPAIELVKTAEPTTVAAAGDLVTYTFVGTNTGNVTLSEVAVTDELAGLSDLACTPAAPATLAPDAVITCNATYPARQGDIDNGEIVNTATITGTPPVGDPVDASDTETVTAAPAPALELVKTVDRVAVSAAGEEITYTFTATNIGNVTLTAVAIVDELDGLSELDCDPAVPAGLAPEASITCTAPYVVTQGDIDDGSIVNLATVTGTPPTGPAVSDADDAVVTAAPTPALDLVKTADPATISAAGDEVVFTLTATNVGNVTLSDVGITDDLLGTGLDCDPAAPTTLAPQAALTCTATYIATQVDVDAGEIVNTASATGTSPEGDPVTDTDTVTVTAAPAPSVELVKTATPTTVAAAGDQVTYTVVGTNTGNVTLTDVAVTDELEGLSALDCTPAAPATLAPDAVITCTATYTATQADLDAGEIVNTATITGTPPEGDPVADTDDETVTAAPAPAIELVKSADPATVAVAGDEISYTFVGINTGNVTLTDVGVTDELDGLSALDCTPAAPATLAPDAVITCTATYTATQADLDAGEIVNTATITGTPPEGHPATDTDDETVNAAAAPAIDLVKTADPTSVTAAGDQVTYTFAGTNTGNVTLGDVSITDGLDGLSDLDCAPAAPAELAPNATITCTATYAATQADIDAGDFTNTATITGTPPEGDPVSYTDAATVLSAPGPSIELLKSAGPTLATAAGDTVTYTVVGTNTGNVTLTDVVVTDELDGLSDLDCAPAAPATLAPGADVTCTATYVATQADLDAGEIVNTATISGTPPVGDPVSATDDARVIAVRAPSIALTKTDDPTTVAAAGELVTYTFVGTNTGNVTLGAVAIDDELAGLSELDCTPAAPAELAPDATITCTATYAATQADIDAGEIVNTATITGTPPEGDPVTDTDDATVTAAADPAIELTKSADRVAVGAAGEQIGYTFTATNTGNVSLTGVAITDQLDGLSDLDCTPTAPAELAPDDVLTCTATYAVTQADVDQGSIVNLATVTGTPPTGPTVGDGDELVVTAAPTPAIELAKTADAATVDAAGDVVTYTLTATNVGNLTLTAVAIEDPLAQLSDLDCTPTAPATLAPQAALTCTATYTATQADIDAGEIVNRATVTATPPSGPVVTAEDTETVTAAPAPALDLVKEATPTTVAAAGEQITYTVTATNTGNVTLAAVAVTDELPGLSELDCTPGQPAELAPGDVLTCEASYTVTQADVNAGEILNTATATGTPPVGDPVTSTDTVTVTVPGVAELTLDKTAAPVAVANAGDEVEYAFVATNTGNVTLTGVSIADELPGLSELDCTPAAPATIEPNETLSCSASYVVSQADIDAGSVVNTATASGTPPTGPAVSDSDVAVVTATPTPAIELDKSAVPASVSAAGDQVTFDFVVTNVGNVTLSGVSITDELAGLSELECDPGQPATLAPTATLTCVATYTATQADADAGEIVNTAAVTGTPTVGDPVTDEDSVTVTIAPDAGIELVKSAEPTSVSVAGDEVTYTFVATNTGNVSLAGVQISDQLTGLSDLDCAVPPPAVLAPDDTLTCTATYAATQADVDAGEIVNTAAVTGTPPVGDPVSDRDGARVVIAPDPAIELTKTVDPTSPSAAGDEVTYTFLATNTGNVTLGGVAITDGLDGLSPLDCALPQPATLAPDGILTCTATYAVTQADADAGELVNRASVAGTPAIGDPVADTAEATLSIGPDPSLALVKTAEPTTVSNVGDEVSYTFVGTNTGNVTLAGVEIVDELAGLSDLDCTPAAPATLAPEATITCVATYTATQSDIDAGGFTNAATVTGTPPVGDPVTGRDAVTVTAAPAPALELAKTADPVAVLAAGDEVTYTFVATNVGNLTLTGVEISDELIGLSDLDCDAGPPVTLAPEDTLTCTATYAATQADIDAGSFVNTAAVTGTPPVGPAVGDEDDALVTATPTAAIEVVKTADPDTVAAVGEEIGYTVEATNLGNVTLTGVDITDDLPGLSDLTCTPAAPATLEPRAALTCTASYAVTQADLDAGEIVNGASASGTPPVGDPVTDTDAVTVQVVPAGSIALVKSASPIAVSAVGDEVTYTFVATNTGNVTLTEVTLDDPLPGISAIECDLDSPVRLAPDDVLTCTATYAATQADVDAGRIVNTASVTGTPPVGDPVSDEDGADVTIAPAADLALVKSASPTTVTAVGDQVDFTVVATNSGNVTLTGVAITDALPGVTGLECDPGQPAVLAPDATLTCTASYLATQADVDAGEIVNTASVTGDPPTGEPVGSSSAVSVAIPADPALTVTKEADPTSVPAAGAVVTYNITLTNSGNVSLTDVALTDTLPGLSTPVCAPALSTSLRAGASVECTATYTVTQEDANAGSVTNTATVTGRPPVGDPVSAADDAVVSVGPAPAIELVKTASATGGAVGDAITYGFVATNTGNVSLTGVRITDELAGLSEQTCTPGQPATLAPGAALQCTARYELSQADVDAGEVVNTAAVTGTPPEGDPVDDEDTFVITATQQPGLALVKTADTDAVRVGEAITYTLAATNTGNTTLSDVSISDPLEGLSGLTCTPSAPTVLAPGEVLTCTATYTPTATDARRGSVLNTATALGLPPGSDAVLSSDDAAAVKVTRVPTDSDDDAEPGSSSGSGGGSLPSTGGPTVGWFALALLLIFAGGAALLTDRRRRRT